MHHATPAGANAPAAPPRAPALEELTPEQRNAVEHDSGPLMVFAGPGAGKTRTITHRIAHLLASGQARPTQILAVTFTVAAAAQMRERIAAMLGIEAARGLTVATFHSLCARLLRAHAGLYDRGADYTIYDPNDLAAVIKHVLLRASRGSPPPVPQSGGAHPAAEISPGEVAWAISLAKNRLWTPEHYRHHSAHPGAEVIADTWTATDRELRASNAFDFDDLLVYGVRLLAENSRLRSHYRSRWPWLLVDEFQDTNFAQMAIVSLLAGPAGNATVVCDDDQLIFTWRGAQADNVLRFGDWFPGFRAVALRHNYRSRAEILDAAVSCVRRNTRRVDKQLVAVRGRGGRIQALRFANDHHEAAAITNLVTDALRSGVAPGEILILARNAYLTGPLQQTLAASGIPYRVLGALGLFERAEVRDAIAYLRLLSNPCDGQAFRRAVSAPRRGVGPATATRIIEYARETHGGDLIAACLDAEQIDGIRQRATRDALVELGAGLQAVRSELGAGRSIGHAVLSAVMLPGGLVAHHRQIAWTSPDADKRRDAERVLEDLRSLCRAAHTYAGSGTGDASIQGFLETACGLDDASELEGEDSRLTISTIHRSKGMEAHLVVLIGCEDRLLPSWRSLEEERPGDGPSGGLEEERRLFYVAVTRAKDHLVITQARSRGDRDTEGPSRFLAEAGLA
jgi:DNA helicase II / ATP-dependent DNA helicase PcrA